MDDDMDFDGFLSSVDTIFYGRISYDAWEILNQKAVPTTSKRIFGVNIHSKKKYVFSKQNRQDENATFINSVYRQKLKK
jgi:dihydrofolate reductase